MGSLPELIKVLLINGRIQEYTMGFEILVLYSSYGMDHKESEQRRDGRKKDK